MYIVLLSGGSGKRLWPLSNDVMSKQFLRLLKDDKGNKESMVQRVYRQLKESGLDAKYIIASSKQQTGLINTQLGNNVEIVCEPERRNTFPAIMLACSYLKDIKQINNEESIIVLPIDSFVDNNFFKLLKLVDNSIQNNENDITLIGIKPTYPSEKYGYIICEEGNNSRKVINFIEKPNINDAKKCLEKNAYWNAGVFGFKLKFIEKIIKRQGFDSYYQLLYNYNQLDNVSFDYAVVEKTKRISVITYGGNWKDLGTWNTLSEEMEHDNNNVIVGENCVNTSIINVTEMPIVALGLNDIVVAVSNEGILVSNKDKSSYLKKYVDDLSGSLSYSKKIWGEEKIINYYENSKAQTIVKIIQIEKNKEASYQTKNKESVTLIVQDGEGSIMYEEKVFKTVPGCKTNINENRKYTIKSNNNLLLIQISTILK